MGGGGGGWGGGVRKNISVCRLLEFFIQLHIPQAEPKCSMSTIELAVWEKFEINEMLNYCITSFHFFFFFFFRNTDS